jgi:hypothetical protein
VTTTGTAVTVDSIVVGPTSTEGVNKFLANLAKKTNESLPELEASQMIYCEVQFLPLLDG